MSAKAVTIRGADKLIRKLQRLGRTAAKRANRKAVNAGLTPILRAVRSNAPRDDGDLAKAMTRKVYGRRGFVGGVVGADAAYATTDERGQPKVPARYDHLVEFGHVNADGSFTPPDGYMRRAQAQSRPASEAAYTNKLRAELEREASR